MGPDTVKTAPDPRVMSPRLGGREFDKFRGSNVEEGLSVVAVSDDDGRSITQMTNYLLEQILRELQQQRLASVLGGSMVLLGDEQVN